jgi:predicted SAM-dependent methyltransferase
MAFKVWQIHKIMEKIQRLSTICLHLACSNDLKPGYINADRFYPEVDVRMDICDIPFKNNSIELIEMHHALEHLPLESVSYALIECRRVLKQHGFLFISVPDLKACMRAFLRASYKIQYDSIIKMIYGSQEHEGMFHKSGFTAKKIEYLLTDIGFKIIKLETGIRMRPTPSLVCVAQRV